MDAYIPSVYLDQELPNGKDWNAQRSYIVAWLPLGLDSLRKLKLLP